MSDPKKPKDESPQQVKGTVFMGPGSDKEATVDNFTIIQTQNPWDRRTESEYMERVREKAALRVQAMLNQARSNAEAMRKTARQWADKVKEETNELHEQAKGVLLEAERIKAEAEQMIAGAHEEGLRKGIEQAMQELEEHRNILNATTASVLKTIEGQSSIIFENWRLELAELVKTSVEVATGWVLSKEYASILENAISTAIQKLEEHRQITVRINKGDQETIENGLLSVKENFPELKSWEIKLDPSLNPGDIVVESLSGMVDNRLTLRQEEVKTILQNLTIPESSIEQTASHNIRSTLESTGISAVANNAPHETTLTEEELSIAPEEEHPAAQNNIEQENPQEIQEVSSPDTEEFSFPELEGIELPPDNITPQADNLDNKDSIRALEEELFSEEQPQEATDNEPYSDTVDLNDPLLGKNALSKEDEDASAMSNLEEAPEEERSRN